MGSLPATTVLLLESGLDGTPLRKTGEFKRIRRALARTERGRTLAIEHEYAVTADELVELVTRHRPQIVHFSGHTDSGELVFCGPIGERRPADRQAIAELFGVLSRYVSCVVLNTCDSELQAELIARHIDVVVANRGPIQDEAAIEFAVAFYRGLGAGHSFDAAYRLGREAIPLAGLPDHDAPRLFARRGVDPARLALPVAQRHPEPAGLEQPPAKRRRRPLLKLMSVATIGVGLWVAGQELPELDDGKPKPESSDERRGCERGVPRACAKLGARLAHEGQHDEANGYFQTACELGDTRSCQTLVPSAEQVCEHTMRYLVRTPSEHPSEGGSVSRATTEACMTGLIEEVELRGRSAYVVYAECVLDSASPAAIEGCRNLYLRAEPQTTRRRPRPH